MTGPILREMLAFFTADGWDFRRLGDDPVLQLRVTTSNGTFACFAQADDPAARFVFYAVAPFRAPEDRLPEFAELLTRANYGLMIGNFELDWSDGEIRYKSSVDVEGDRISAALIRQASYAAVRGLGRYLPALEALAKGGISPAGALAQVERGPAVPER